MGEVAKRSLSCVKRPTGAESRAPWYWPASRPKFARKLICCAAWTWH